VLRQLEALGVVEAHSSSANEAQLVFNCVAARLLT
jgi:hypothetical protein